MDIGEDITAESITTTNMNISTSTMSRPMKEFMKGTTTHTTMRYSLLQGFIFHYLTVTFKDIEYRDEIDIGGGGRVAFDTGSRFGGLDLAAALGLSGVGYVANSGGALHVVG